VSPGLLGALLAAVAYGAATVLQAIGVRRVGALPPGTPLPARVRAGWPYAVGLALDGLGFLASVAALRTLPLFLVESAVASSVAVTAVLSVLVLHVRLGTGEVVALLAVAAGLTGLAFAAAEGPPLQSPAAAAWWLLGAAGVVAVLLVAGERDPNRRRGAVVLSLAAGLGFGGVGVAARLLEVPSPLWHLLTSAMAWALLAHAALATVAYALALSRGRVTTVAALTFATETVVPAVVGLVALGDRVVAGRGPVAVVAFALTLGGCIALAGRAEPPEPPGRTASSEGAGRAGPAATDREDLPGRP
jgi:drug/metabolite transporter (DMT)-like permease